MSTHASPTSSSAFDATVQGDDITAARWPQNVQSLTLHAWGFSAPCEAAIPLPASLTYLTTYGAPPLLDGSAVTLANLWLHIHGSQVEAALKAVASIPVHRLTISIRRTSDRAAASIMRDVLEGMPDSTSELRIYMPCDFPRADQEALIPLARPHTNLKQVHGRRQHESEGGDPTAPDWTLCWLRTTELDHAEAAAGK